MDLGGYGPAGGVGDVERHGVDDAPQMRADHSRDLLDRLEPRPHGLGDPGAPLELRAAALDKAPKAQRGFLQGPGLVGLEVHLVQGLERSRSFLVQVAWVGEPVVARALERVVALGEQVPVFRSPYAKHGLAEVASDV